MDGKRDAEQPGDQDEDVAAGEAQQDEQTSGDEQSVAEDPEIEIERQQTGDPSRTERK